MDRLKHGADTALIGALLSSPAWVGWLERVNLVLTTATLLIGLVIGVWKLRCMVSRHHRR